MTNFGPVVLISVSTPNEATICPIVRAHCL
ncbi:hypothetical protein APX70_200284 [Pseudomonas syringae pv. maculicola]|uniref:Uncharacterized protein n=1 Tax=Pseudomonas syringae pv. maculicola TaxID=59511 RepID=A0A3M2WD46_PSEYM|nr:hypothetical protein APX70_200284 [Pseudomonas syringae pv. maculicola]